MAFIRNGDPLESLKIGRRANLDIVSWIEVDLLKKEYGSYDSNGCFNGTSSVLITWNGVPSEHASKFLSQLETGFIGKKFIMKYFWNVDRHKLEKADHIHFSFGIKPENRINEEPYGRHCGELVWEHDNKIYNIPEVIKLENDLFWNMRPWNIKHLRCELRKIKR